MEGNDSLLVLLWQSHLFSSSWHVEEPSETAALPIWWVELSGESLEPALVVICKGKEAPAPSSTMLFPLQIKQE